MLRRSPGERNGRLWYRQVHFGPGFAEALEASYERVASHPVQPGDEWTLDVWRPRPGGG